MLKIDFWSLWPRSGTSGKNPGTNTCCEWSVERNVDMDAVSNVLPPEFLALPVLAFAIGRGERLDGGKS